MKESYKEMLRTKVFKLEWFYECYTKNFDRIQVKKGKSKPPFLNFQMFSELFKIYFQQNFEEIIDLLNKELNINYIKNSQGDYIWVE